MVRTSTYLSATAVVVIYVTQASAMEPLVIDDFRSGEGFGVVLPSPSVPGFNRIDRFESGLNEDSVLGGQRSLDFHSCIGIGGPQGTTGPMPVVHDPGSGTIVFGGTPGSQFCEGPSFAYGDRFNGEPSLNLDTTPYNALLVELSHVDSGEPNLWYEPPERPTELFLGVGTGYQLDDGRDRTAIQTFRWPLAETNRRTVFAVPISPDFAIDGFRPQFDRSDIDSITFSVGRLGAGAGIGLAELSLAYLPALEGDFDGDGEADSADWEVYLHNHGRDAAALPARLTVRHGLGADGNGDGVVNAADYTVWRDAVEAAAIAVPEPASCCLALGLVASGMARRPSS